MTDTATSPLATTDPDSLTAYFLSDPRDLSAEDYSALLRELRRRRSEFASQEAAKAAEGKKAKAPKAEVRAASAAALDKPIAETTIDDLFS